MNIYVNLETLSKTVEAFKNNNNFLVINNNVFSTKYIKTLLNIEQEDTSKQLINVTGKTSFSFSYNDECLAESINIVYNHEDYLCINFVKNCKLISDSEIDKLILKSNDVASKKFNQSSDALYIPDMLTVDEIFYNEVQVLISSKINENDKENIIDDFKSKYEAYKEKKLELTTSIQNLINELHNLILLAMTQK